MKNYVLAVLCCIMLFTGCNSDDNDTITVSTSSNSFDVDGTNYNTPNGFLFLDDGPPFTNKFFFVFTDGMFREDTVNGASISTDADVASALFVELGPGTVATEMDVLVNPGTYILDSQSEIITQINTFQDTYVNSGVTYGEPDNADILTINTTGNGALTINSINIDYVARSGTVDVTYSLTANNGEIINGSYVGTFSIINEF